MSQEQNDTDELKKSVIEIKEMMSVMTEAFKNFEISILEYKIKTDAKLKDLTENNKGTEEKLSQVIATNNNLVMEKIEELFEHTATNERDIGIIKYKLDNLENVGEILNTKFDSTEDIVSKLEAWITGRDEDIKILYDSKLNKNDIRLSKLENEISSASKSKVSFEENVNEKGNSPCNDLFGNNGRQSNRRLTLEQSVMQEPRESGNNNGGSPIFNNNPGVIIQQIYEPNKNRLTNLENPDIVADFYREVRRHIETYPTAQFKLALLMSETVKLQLVSKFGHSYSFGQNDFTSLNNEIINTMIMTEVKATSREKFLYWLRKPLKSKPLENYNPTNSDFKIYAGFILRAINEFKDRHSMLYDGKNDRISPEVNDKPDGIINVWHLVFKNACGQMDPERKEYVVKIWTRMSKDDSDAIKYGKIAGSINANKEERLEYYVNVLRKELQEDITKSEQSQNLNSSLGISPYRPNNRPSENTQNPLRNRDGFRQKQFTPNISRKRVHNIDQDDENDDDNSQTKVETTISEQEYDDTENEETFEAQLAAFQAPNIDKSDRPNGCHEQVIFGKCRKHEAQLKGARNSKNEPIQCTYSHDDATLQKTHAYLSKQLALSPFKAKWEPRGTRVSMITKDKDEKEAETDY